MSSTLSLDFQYTTSIERLWTALTDSSKLAKWVVNIHTGQAMENDFMPVVGHHFQFRTQPTEWWDGIVNGESYKIAH
ncbi:BH2087 [Halalkalibacterium halodurans C-125]|uniref:BH2087 protein n=1 Tax=Halalkalibacterium halodurans (strain ATCC BAA-125 / DSM 18197 / FERM 7344 / JCM 9153 / C-125) TaxID=272558 RepID=Q9KB44_HALH5|nr:BH2087 [Halalkalibacterium halodurans C-125]